MSQYSCTFPTFAGDFSIAVDDTGAVVAAGFGGRSAPAQLGPDPGAEPGDRRAAETGERPTARARRQVEEYFAGTRRKFDLELRPKGTVFQKRVWEALRWIPFGSTATYREMASAIGRPAAARAVGGATGANPICIIIPCHRVIGADGSLTGFAFGVETKRKLLLHEGALAALPAPTAQSFRDA